MRTLRVRSGARLATLSVGPLTANGLLIQIGDGLDSITLILDALDVLRATQMLHECLDGSPPSHDTQIESWEGSKNPE